VWFSRYRHLVASPLSRRKAWPSGKLKRWQELALIEWWRENLDTGALDALVEAHRWMVANLAQGYVGDKRKTLIEYGMFGLRLAATTQWPNRKRKGKLAGYDPTKARFSTFARSGQVKRLMLDAASADRRTVEYDNKRVPLQRPTDKKEEFDAWAKTPIPPEIEDRCRNRFDGSTNADIPFWHQMASDTVRSVVFDFDAPWPKRRGRGAAYAWFRYPRHFPDRGPASPASPDTRAAPLRVRTSFKHQRDRFNRPSNETRQTYLLPPEWRAAPPDDALVRTELGLDPRVFSADEPRCLPDWQGNAHCFCIIADAPEAYDVTTRNVDLLWRSLCFVYWQEGYFVYRLRDTEEAKKRNYLTSKVTDLERQNRRKFYEKYGAKLATHALVAEAGMGGWEGDGDQESGYEDGTPLSTDLGGDSEDKPLWQPCTGSFQKDQYTLPPAIKKMRWRLAGGRKQPYHGDANQGLGLYDRRGRALFYRNSGRKYPNTPVSTKPEFCTSHSPGNSKTRKRTYYSRLGCCYLDCGSMDLDVKKIIQKNRRKLPNICLNPLSGICLVGTEAISRRRMPRLWLLQLARRRGIYRRQLQHKQDRQHESSRRHRSDEMKPPIWHSDWMKY
jgi:hypothetical protein